MIYTYPIKLMLKDEQYKVQTKKNIFFYILVMF